MDSTEFRAHDEEVKKMWFSPSEIVQEVFIFLSFLGLIPHGFFCYKLYQAGKPNRDDKEELLHSSNSSQKPGCTEFLASCNCFADCTLRTFRSPYLYSRFKTPLCRICVQCFQYAYLFLSTLLLIPAILDAGVVFNELN